MVCVRALLIFTMRFAPLIGHYFRVITIKGVKVKYLKVCFLAFVLTGCTTTATNKAQFKPSISVISSINAACSSKKGTWLLSKNKNYVALIDNTGKEHDKELTLTEHSEKIMKDKSINHIFSFADYSYDKTSDIEKSSRFTLSFNEEVSGQYEIGSAGRYNLTLLAVRVLSQYNIKKNLGGAKVVCTLNLEKSPAI